MHKTARISLRSMNISHSSRDTLRARCGVPRLAELAWKEPENLGISRFSGSLEILGRFCIDLQSAICFSYCHNKFLLASRNLSRSAAMLAPSSRRFILPCVDYLMNQKIVSLPNRNSSTLI